MKIGRKQLVLASMILALGAAVYLNWQFAGTGQLPLEEEEDPASQRVYISHGDCQQEAEALAVAVQTRLGVASVTVGDVGPVIGAHSGAGTLALFFLGKAR